MKPCISQATTLTTPFEQDLRAYARAGWTAVEIWLTKLEAYLQSHSLADARALLAEHNLQAAAAAAQGGLLLSTGDERRAHWDDFKRRLELLTALEVPTLVIAADYVREPAAADYARAVDSLAEAAALAQQAGVRLALEFQKQSHFCTSLDTAVALVEQAGSRGAGVCLDLFHYYTGPSKLEDLAYLTPENLAWVQVCDLSGTPRELARDADRILPGDGDFQLGPILEHLARIGYEGGVSLELMNPQLWPISAEQLADVGQQAMTRTLALAQGPVTASGGP